MSDEPIRDARLTLDQAITRLVWRMNVSQEEAGAFRLQARDYSEASRETTDPELRRVHFERSSELLAEARLKDREIEALALVIEAARRTQEKKASEP